MIGSPLGGKVASVSGPSGTVTLVEGRSFCLSEPSGDITPGTAQGLFVLDTRAMSRWELRVNGDRLEGLSVEAHEPYAATFVGRARPQTGQSDATLVIFRRRLVGRGMCERITVVNYSTNPSPVTLEMVCDSDFAGIFEVKNGRLPARPRQRSDRVSDRGLVLACEEGPSREVKVVVSEPAIIEAGQITWRRTLWSGERWQVCCEISTAVEGHARPPRFRCDSGDQDTVPFRRLTSWRARLPEVSTANPAFDSVIARSGEDLGSLRIFDPDHPHLPILAAGAPWYMTVFGRDSLLTGWMTLLADPSLAKGVLELLAQLQGNQVCEETEEEPGKILHEIRLDLADGTKLAQGHVYYGSIDSTPLFVMLLGEAARWGLDRQTVARLLPHADRALEWIETFGDRDGDGYVEYRRATAEGLLNQGWKDSWDGILFADGRFAQPPIALCEVQGYVYGAYLARAHLAEDLDDTATARRYRHKARDLKDRFNRDFWLQDRGWYALGLDASKRPIDALASNMGHCLWSEIIDPERSELVADRLLSPELFSGWGVRTLATSMAAYNPVSYHNGSVWPHDNAIIAAGLARYGHLDAAQRVIAAQLEVALHCGGRLPELFAGFAREEFATPASYPSSCSPQAWAAAAPLLWLRTLIGLEPWTAKGELWVATQLPDWVDHLHVERVALGQRRVSVHIEGGRAQVEGAGPLKIIPKTRPPLASSSEHPSSRP